MLESHFFRLSGFGLQVYHMEPLRYKAPCKGTRLSAPRTHMMDDFCRNR
jgi:hypothetical protein